MCQWSAAPISHHSWAGAWNQRLTIGVVDYKKEIGRRLKDARLKKGWTLEDLSRQTKDVLSDTRISNYETGFRMPGPQEAVILASALGERPAFLMAVDDIQIQITTQEESLIRNWRTLSERERMDFYRSVEAMAMASRDPVGDKRVLQAQGPVRGREPQKKREKS